MVVAHLPPAEHRPDGGAQAVLSTYGISDQSYGELAARWAPWWGERFPS